MRTWGGADTAAFGQSHNANVGQGQVSVTAAIRLEELTGRPQVKAALPAFC
jgi:hypothetical protein